MIKRTKKPVQKIMFWVSLCSICTIWIYIYHIAPSVYLIFLLHLVLNLSTIQPIQLTSYTQVQQKCITPSNNDDVMNLNGQGHDQQHKDSNIVLSYKGVEGSVYRDIIHFHPILLYYVHNTAQIIVATLSSSASSSSSSLSCIDQNGRVFPSNSHFTLYQLV